MYLSFTKHLFKGILHKNTLFHYVITISKDILTFSFFNPYLAKIEKGACVFLIMHLLNNNFKAPCN